METGNAKRQSQPSEFKDATSQMREETSTSAFVALIATNAILLLMLAA
jgi:hypothetical protein